MGWLKNWRMRTCQKRGHIPIGWSQTGMIRSERYPAREATRRIFRCSRCKEALSKQIIEEGRSLDSLSMSQEDWRIMERDGFLPDGPAFKNGRAFDKGELEMESTD